MNQNTVSSTLSPYNKLYDKYMTSSWSSADESLYESLYKFQEIKLKCSKCENIIAEYYAYRKLDSIKQLCQTCYHIKKLKE